jgi:transmembrane sensor
MEISSTVREKITAEAVDWFLRLQEGLGSDADRLEFSEWLLRSPVHVEEYLAVSRAWGALNVPQGNELDTDSLIAAAREDQAPSNVIPLHPKSAETVETPTRAPEWTLRMTRKRLLASAASILLGAALWGGYQLRFAADIYQTVVGEQRSVTLTDGSVVYLNTNSSVRVRWTTAERHIDLLRGEARFQVAKNPVRPFIVATAEATVRAVGTVFNVRADTTRTQVAVIEGRVEVKALDERPHGHSQTLPTASAATTGGAVDLQLSAGEHAEVAMGAIKPNAGPPMEAVRSWTERRLVFRGESLATVIDEFNRYRSHPLVLDDSQLASLSISGAFNLDDPDSLISYLKSFETVQVSYGKDGSQHLSR